MPEPTISGRALALALGVDEKAVRKAVESGRISKEPGGKFDLAACRAAWNRSTDPARSKVRTGADHAPGPQSAAHKVRTSRSAPHRPADAAALWATLDYLVALVPWAVAEHGGELQLAFNVHSDLALDLPAEFQRRGFALPGALEAVEWAALAEAHDLAPINPHAMADDYARRRAQG